MLRITSRWLIAPLLLLAPEISRAQNITGTLLGDVRDATGAALARTQVTITSVATNQSVHTLTDALGHYEAAYLKPDVYTVRVNSPGFKTSVQDQVKLAVDSRLRLDFVLEVGDVSATVDVTARAAMVETETGSLGQVIGEKTLEEMPLQGRNVFDLVGLAAGCTGESLRDRRRSLHRFHRDRGHVPVLGHFD